jgi:hypothetical protein
LTILATAVSAASNTANNVEPGLLGFLVVAALGVALVFLLRSMNKHLRKIGPKPEEEVADTGTAGQPATGQPADEAAKETADQAQSS